MDLPVSARINKIVDALQHPDDYGLTPETIDRIQADIDEMAKSGEVPKSQEYKVLFAQALIHYQNSDDNEALNFTEAAISSRGSNFKEAQDLIDKIYQQDSIEKDDDRLEYSGKIEGWLAFYSLTFILSPFYLLYDIFVDGADLKNMIQNYAAEYPNFAADINLLFVFIVLFDAITLLFLLVFGYLFFTKNAATRMIAIFYSLYTILGTLVFLVLLFNFYAKYEIPLSEMDSTTAGYLFRGIFISLIWMFYWIYSKRVRATFVD